MLSRPYLAWVSLSFVAENSMASSQDTTFQGSLMESRIIGSLMRSLWVA